MSVLQSALHNLARWREDARRFAMECLGVTEMDHFQEEFLLALSSGKPIDNRIALKASKGPGKTWCLAIAGWWFLVCQGDKGEHPNGIAVSITQDNLRDNLWKEFAKWQGRSELLKSAFTWTKTKIFCNDHPGTWWISARTWSKQASPQEQSDALSGLHSGYVMVLMDETGGFPSSIMATGEAALASCIWGKICQAGNPTMVEGPLYDACTRHKDHWHVITINADPDSPTRAKRVPVEWARTQIALYGRDNPWVLVNVFGEFPPASINTLLSDEEVEAAYKRWRGLKEPDFEYAQRRIGCDVARFGDDRQVFFPRQGRLTLEPVIDRNKRGPEMAQRIARMINNWGGGKVHIFVDDTGGYGANLQDALIQIGYPYIPVNFAGKATDPRFENKRMEIWWEMAEWIKRGGTLPPTLTDLKVELTSVHYTYTGKDKMILEPKADVKTNIGYSPDLADALAVTFAIPDMPDVVNPEGARLAAIGDYGRPRTDWDPLDSAYQEAEEREAWL